MNFPGKDFWYDWSGANVWLFLQINAIRGGEYYDKIMIGLSKIGDHHNFPYYMAGLVAFALLSYCVRKVAKQGGASHLMAAWLAVLLVLVAGYGAEAYIIHHAKEYFSYPRPYVVLAHDTRLLEIRPADDNYHSFPSGHAAFITLMVVGLWPVLSKPMKWVGAALIIGVMWSRLVLGVHFPADVTLSLLMFSIMVLILQIIVYRLLRRMGVKC